MDRTIVQRRTELGWERAAWFDLDAATHILTEATRWDGQNHIGKISGLQIRKAELYRTARGKWVEHTDASCEHNGPNRWVYLDDDEARDWMIRSGGDEAETALAKWFPDTPDETGPSKGGRPKVGPSISVAYPDDLLQRITEAAKASGMDRAKWLRDAAEAYLANPAV